MWQRLFALIAVGLTLACLAGCAALPPTAAPNQEEALGSEEGAQVYEIVERMTVVNKGPGEPSKHNLWVALIQDQPPYQEVLSRTISPGDYILFTDEYGNQYAEFDFAGMAVGTSIPVEIQYQVRVNDVAFDLGPCDGELPDFFTEPDLHIEANNPQISALARRLSAGKNTTCEQVRAFYDYIGDNLLYSYNGASWGAQAALGEMGADCTEYASLLIALSRAAGIPARYLEGLYHNGGRQKALARSEHDIADGRGLSLFVSERSERIKVRHLEHKLGIHGSPTCVLAYDGSVGYLIGEPNRGMRYMFKMMNQARREVGLEGLGIAERAYQQAVSYAIERKQGRAVGAPKTEQSPIIEHPDVRRMLMTMKAYNEAARGLLYDTAAAGERSDRHPEEHGRAEAADRVALLTPIAKAWSTDMGVAMTSLGIQVHGGVGYVEETGAAQYLRDARITPIYEGTNGIQAIDLVMRKLPMSEGSVVHSYLEEMADLADALASNDDTRLAMIGGALGAGVGTLGQATEWLLECDDVNDRLAGATPYLDMFGTVAGGYYAARLALAAAGEDPDPWYEAKIDTAAFYAGRLLPRAAGLLSAVTAGAGGIFAVPVQGLETSR
jgi:hypothetical protein